MRTTVLGGGAWGTALASHCVRAGLPVRIWIREPEVAVAVNERRENTVYLPGVPLPEGLHATARLDEALSGAETVLVVVPSEFCRGIYGQAAALAPGSAVLVSATKGIEVDTLARMSEVAAAEAPGHPLAVLSGPSFALEVARALPTAVVVASADHGVAESVQRALSTRTFRAYSSEDVVGVELAGALKNVIAIAAGIVDGLGYGHNTVAALITRGLAEITRLAVALGARPDTLAGLAGLGDLVLTCTGGLSRNRTVGQRLGRGLPLSEASAGIHPEGVRTTLAACSLAERQGIEMPIARQMKAVLHAGKPPRAALDELMLRTLKRE
ncbi:MAG TPA: NAD(P)H-dependent glycerol-3-phosphate dehydrogenase [Vicinamibacteria bacterium]|nr:NAD(P)H-dependent glycerol-3-phosphate dehydrogenase [Vicinamibacteria bacterium]